MKHLDIKKISSVGVLIGATLNPTRLEAQDVLYLHSFSGRTTSATDLSNLSGATFPGLFRHQNGSYDHRGPGCQSLQEVDEIIALGVSRLDALSKFTDVVAGEVNATSHKYSVLRERFKDLDNIDKRIDVLARDLKIAIRELEQLRKDVEKNKRDIAKLSRELVGTIVSSMEFLFDFTRSELDTKHILPFDVQIARLDEIQRLSDRQLGLTRGWFKTISSLGVIDQKVISAGEARVIKSFDALAVQNKIVTHRRFDEWKKHLTGLMTARNLPQERASFYAEKVVAVACLQQARDEYLSSNNVSNETRDKLQEEVDNAGKKIAGLTYQDSKENGYYVASGLSMTQILQIVGAAIIAKDVAEMGIAAYNFLHSTPSERYEECLSERNISIDKLKPDEYFKNIEQRINESPEEVVRRARIERSRENMRDCCLAYNNGEVEQCEQLGLSKAQPERVEQLKNREAQKKQAKASRKSSRRGESGHDRSDDRGSLFDSNPSDMFSPEPSRRNEVHDTGSTPRSERSDRSSGSGSSSGGSSGSSNGRSRGGHASRE